MDISKAEKKLAQAEYFLRCLEAAPAEISKAQFGARAEPTELLDYNYSACLSAAQSAFYALGKAAGKRLFNSVTSAWRKALPDDAARHEFNDMIARRDDDVHYGDFNAEALPTMMPVDFDACGMYSQHNAALLGPAALATYTHPDGRVSVARGLTSTRRLYIDRDGKTVDATTACAAFIAQLRSLCDAVRNCAGT